METEAGRTVRESLELAFQMSSIMGAGLDRPTLSLLIALLDRGVNPEALSALVLELAPTAVGAARESLSSRRHHQ